MISLSNTRWQRTKQIVGHAQIFHSALLDAEFLSEVVDIDPPGLEGDSRQNDDKSDQVACCNTVISRPRCREVVGTPSISNSVKALVSSISGMPKKSEVRDVRSAPRRERKGVRPGVVELVPNNAPSSGGMIGVLTKVVSGFTAGTGAAADAVNPWKPEVNMSTKRKTDT